MDKWHEVYRELAKLLSQFYELHKSKSGNELYKICANDVEFGLVNSRMTNFGGDFNITSLDPIHVFASLNESGYSELIRIKRINNFFKILGSDTKFRSIDFTGCPTPFSLKIMAARKQDVQLEIWEVFNLILKDGQKGLNEDSFLKIKKWYGVNIISFTIFLFWIDSENFLPLDKNTNQFLVEKNIYHKRPRNYTEYIKIIPIINTDIYRIIANTAYTKTGSGFALNEYLYNYYEKVIPGYDNYDPLKEPIRKIDFKLVAIKVFDKTDKKYLKVLNHNYPYLFYNCYKFIDESKIKYSSETNHKLFKVVDNTYEFDVNISAIVGKNGAGKSSITELLYIAINNFTHKALGQESELTYVNDVYLELFYHTDTIYKIKIEGDKLTLTRYNSKGDIFEQFNEINLNKNCLEDFFYTISVNYSHYALNSRDIGNWITDLFHKNDGYQTPIVINPMRTDGNININIENSLVKSRLLNNILEPVQNDSTSLNLRELTDDNRYTEYLQLNLNQNKVAYLYKINGTDKVKLFPNEKIWKKIIEKIYSYFEIEIKQTTVFTIIAEKYIYKKIVNIGKNYKRYNRFLSKDNIKISLINKYLDRLMIDNSHITYKFRQAVYFLKYDHLKLRNYDEPILIDLLSKEIEKVINENYSPTLDLKTIELIPPSFFNIEILLNDGSNFELLSSGEKQRIHSVNSLFYHLQNLESVSQVMDDESYTIKYSHINILFDEVELYFHPDMQRTFISYFLNYFKKLKFDFIESINICFVTHSPFILSDIPNENVMFLKKGEGIFDKTEQIINKDNRTFGANIHELLSTGFFLDKGFMGEFAKEKINDLIKYLKSETQDNLDNISDNWSEKKAEDFINIIGEPLIRESLMSLYHKKFYSREKTLIENRIKQLEQELKKFN